MKFFRFAVVIALPPYLASCAFNHEGDTLADLRDVKIEIREAQIEGGIEKAIQSYQRFLEETPDSHMTPEAMRRLADLKIEKEYGVVQGPSKSEGASRKPLDRPQGYTPSPVSNAPQAEKAPAGKPSESVSDFEKRATKGETLKRPVAPIDPSSLPEGGDDLENADAAAAIVLYQKLLAKYPLYERNDEVLYNMSRAYEELGKVEDAMTVMNRLVKQYPHSKYIDEVQFRRGEYFFTRKKFLDAEDAYKSIVDLGASSYYYDLALYKLGWTFYKQELYEDSLQKFFGLLDYKVAKGFDFEKSADELDKKRVDDTYRVISLAFSNLGGPSAVDDYFAKYGKRPYEVNVYSNLGEYYLDKSRYNDAAAAYQSFVRRNPFHKVAPQFDMRVIEIYKKGGFPRLVIDSSKEFVTNYGLKSEYWKHFDVKAYPEVLGHVKQNLRELANYYHALYQDKQYEKTKDENFREARRWYAQFLESFPKDPETPGINYQMAELLLQNKAYAEAAAEYERTAYTYAPHPKAADAGYAAVYALRENVNVVGQNDKDKAKREVIRSSLKFADTFPKNDKAPAVLGAAADDLYEMKDYPLALTTARKLIAAFPQSEQSIRRSAWLVVAHSSFELGQYQDAEAGYTKVMQFTPNDDKSRPALIENLAASIYKQGEQANKAQDYRTAATHFLRVAQAAPTSKIRPSAEYDGAVALIQLKDWDKAIEVLQAFRKAYPGHTLQPEVTKKIAFVYKEAGKLSLAAAEYEHVEKESKDEQVRRGALLMAADLYEQAHEATHALDVYRRYVTYFPKPLELALESRYKIAGIYKAAKDEKAYFHELREIVDEDAHAGRERTDRTRYLAALSSLAITEPLYDQLVAIKLVKPLEKNLAKKKVAMKAATEGFGKLADYRVGEVTSAATYYIAEIYYHFSRALMESERPDNLNALEKEQYELALEDQAAPFEDKAIAVHEKNVELMSVGVYSTWIEKSIEKLAKLVPARYAKPEESTGVITSLASFRYELPKIQPAPVPVPTNNAQPSKTDVQTASGDTVDHETEAQAAPNGTMDQPKPAAEAK
jgi:TolA-binding protein